uniref:Retroviral envelope protein GP41-like domain-containing protein n=1 Tax=Sciurus vulgaris TaxID=55149 RepID=A0A8D2B7R0_SCIVU
IPKFIPVPVTLNHSEWNFLPVRAKRDFGISAIIAIAVATAAAAAAATAAGLALGTALPTAHTLNNLSQATAEALTAQENINAHLTTGILILNQRVDLLQEQVDMLTVASQTGWLVHAQALCVTPIPYSNITAAANLSKQLGSMLNGTWSKSLLI